MRIWKLMSNSFVVVRFADLGSDNNNTNGIRSC